ncbi:hypothetical protein D3C75_1231800 [compost metagenome]
MNIPERLMNQIQIQIIQLQAFQRSGKSSMGALITGILNPELRRDEQFFSRHAAPLDRSANRLLIEISSRGIN